MSSTSKQIWEAQKLAEQVEKGEYPVAQSSGVSGASAEQLTTQGQDINVPEDATVGGMRAESSRVVEDIKVTEPIGDRESGPVVGEGQEHKLQEFFGEPTTAGEDKTSIDETDLTPAEKQTRLTDDQGGAEDQGPTVDQDELPSAKQTKVTQENAGDAETGGDADTGDAGTGDAGETTTGDAGTTEETTVIADGNATGDAGAEAAEAADAEATEVTESSGGDT
jgi:hypothetical protein